MLLQGLFVPLGLRAFFTVFTPNEYDVNSELDLDLDDTCLHDTCFGLM